MSWQIKAVYGERGLQTLFAQRLGIISMAHKLSVSLRVDVLSMTSHEAYHIAYVTMA